MKTSLFKKKKITKKEAGTILGGGPTQHVEPSIGEKHTGSWNLIFGYVCDTEPYTDSITVADTTFR